MHKKQSLIAAMFCWITILFTFIAAITLLITKGYNWRFLIWNGDTVGIFPDLFQSIGDGISKAPYDRGAIYPAFAYVICYSLGKLIPGFDYQNWGAMSVSKAATVITFIFFFVWIWGIAFYSKKMLSADSYISFCLILLLLTSAPFIYMLERGNMVIMSMFLTMVFLYGYNAQNKWLKYLAFLSLAMSAALKIYPAILGLLVVQKKKMRDIFLLLFFGIVVFVFPFLFYGKPQDIAKMFRNAFTLNMETLVDTRNFGYGFKISIQNAMDLLSDFFNINLSTLSTFLVAFTLIMLIISSFIINEHWKKIASLYLIITIIPTFSWIYNGIYMFPVLALFLKHNLSKTKVKKIDYIYLLLLLLVFIPLPYGECFSTLTGCNKMSYSTIACSLSLYILSLLFMGEGLRILYRRGRAIVKQQGNRKTNLLS